MTRLVFERSFTKARDMARFFAVVEALEAEGFDVPVDPRWRELERWRGHTDALVGGAAGAAPAGGARRRGEVERRPTR